MNLLSKYLVESIIKELQSSVVVLLPGGFKPPHAGHLELAKRYASQANVSEVRVLIGPKERDGITRDQSVAVWKLLLGNTPNIVVESVADDNPMRAAYKYIETAEPGTYALGASSKGEDYARVKGFVDGHALGAKYHRPGVEVIELSVDTAPIYYKGRTDGTNGKGISASTLRADLAANDYTNFKTNYPNIPESVTKAIFNILTKKTLSERTILTEGGAAGHMTHPYEDYDMSFKDMESMIDAALSGKVEFAQEKLDGQNLMVTYKDGQVRAARNKGHLKNAGETSLTLKQVEDMFANRGPIQTAFTEAMRDMETAINRLTPQQKQEFFGNGSKFVNFEVLYPETANVVPYGAAQLRLHNITEYDESGNVVDTNTDLVKQLDNAIRQVEAQNQKTYEIRVTDPITLNKTKDYEKQKEELIRAVREIKSKFNLKDSDTLSTYLQRWWERFLKASAKAYGYEITPQNIEQLTNRWAFSDKSTNIKAVRDAITNEDFKNWVLSFDKSDYATQKKIAIKPFENLFLKLGVNVLKNISQLVSLNPDQSVRQMRKDLDNAIAQIKQAATTKDMSDDDASLKFLKRELERLKDLGGFDAIVPLEGIVFKYGGKLYKLTGAFAPINQIIGYIKFER
jgi:hypothetical protein